MKKLFLLLYLVLILSSCSTTYHYNMGQSSQAFFEMNKRGVKQLELVRQTTEWAIYRTKGEGSIFFYFKNDALVKVDRGTRSPDLIIQNTSY